MVSADGNFSLMQISGRLYFAACKGVIKSAVCPICDTQMTIADQRPVRPSGWIQAMQMHRTEYFGCPRADEPAHRAAVEKYAEVHLYWHLPLDDLLKLDPWTLFRTRWASAPVRKTR
jgi:hypothetical protein